MSKKWGGEDAREQAKRIRESGEDREGERCRRETERENEEGIVHHLSHQRPRELPTHMVVLLRHIRRVDGEKGRERRERSR